jgi:putative ABC transport system ATP-binding protein
MEPSMTAPSATTAPDRTAVAARAVEVVKEYRSGATTVRALDRLSLDLERGRFTAIMGPSGSGKSTLMHCLAGLDTVDEGQVIVGETDLATLKEKQRTLLRRDQLGFVFQAFNLVPSLTALENIVLPVSLAGRAPDQDWLDELVDTVGLRDRLAHTPAQLSGGQQQRVAMARALVSRPELIFADEPTGNLDSRTGAELLSFLRTAVRELGQTVVMVTHDPIAAAYADRAVFLADGRIVDDMASPTVERILDRMKTLEA